MQRRKQLSRHPCRPPILLLSVGRNMAAMVCIVLCSLLLRDQCLSPVLALMLPSSSSQHIQQHHPSFHLASSIRRCRGGTPQQQQKQQHYHHHHHHHYHPVSSSASSSSLMMMMNHRRTSRPVTSLSTSPPLSAIPSSISSPSSRRDVTAALYTSASASISEDGTNNDNNTIFITDMTDTDDDSRRTSSRIGNNDGDDDDNQQHHQYQYKNRKGDIIYRWTKQNFALAVPALIGMLADPLLSLVDTAYVGRVGSTELAALGACTSIFHLAFNAFRATTTATTSLVGNAHHENERKQIVKISLTLGVVLGFIVMTVLELSGPWCLATMGVPRSSKLFPPAIAYLGARLWAAPAVLAIVVAEGAFRGYGDTTIPLLASLAASVTNLILDPFLMFTLGWGVRGAAAATGISQVGAAFVYFYFLIKRRMLPSSVSSRKRRHNREEASETTTSTTTTPSTIKTRKVVTTILGANLAMVCKQGSLLLAWAYATARATRIGSAHVAAHQVALSSWLVFALILDGAAVSAQVLMSRSMGQYQKVKSLVSYMIRFSIVQGLFTTGAVLSVAPYLPKMFTSDFAIRGHLTSLMPHLAWQQLLVSLTLVTESLAIGGNQFQLLAVGTTLSTIIAMKELQYATTVVDIWSKGIVSLFVGRLITALIGIVLVLRNQKKKTTTTTTTTGTKTTTNDDDGTMTTSTSVSDDFII